MSHEVQDQAAPATESSLAASSAVAAERTSLRSLAANRNGEFTEVARRSDVRGRYEERCLDILLTREAIERLLREAIQGLLLHEDEERDHRELLGEYRTDLAELNSDRRRLERGLRGRAKSAAERRAEARFERILLKLDGEQAGRASPDGPFPSLRRLRDYAKATVFPVSGDPRPNGAEVEDPPERALLVAAGEADRGKSPTRRRLVALGAVVAVGLLAIVAVIAAGGGGDDRSPAATVSGLGPAAGLEKLHLGALVKAGEQAKERKLASARAEAAALRERRLAAAKAKAKAERAAAAEAAAAAEETTTTTTTSTTTTPAPETTTATPAAAPAPAPEPAPEPTPAPSGGGGGADCFTFEC